MRGDRIRLLIITVLAIGLILWLQTLHEFQQIRIMLIGGVP